MLSEQISGVGIFIVNPAYPDSYLTVEEYKTKKTTNKIAGMRSFPMETIERGESHHDAMVRLIAEEVVITPQVLSDQLTAKKLLIAEVMPGVWVHDYLLPTSLGTSFHIGSTAHEVGNLLWTPFTNLHSGSLPGHLFRASNHEVIQAYQTYLEDPQSFVAPRYRFFELYGYLTDEEFEKLSTQTTIQSQAVFSAGQYPLIG